MKSAASVRPRVCYANSATGCGLDASKRSVQPCAAGGKCVLVVAARREVPCCTHAKRGVQFSALAGCGTGRYARSAPTPYTTTSVVSGALP
ncbi:MAG: hypothetical protein Ta2A_18630 [Treponemataceae bacterium]|nr:MAG: hypothetical protein Ta2A_18630 [Treponemataceae bacterium]